MCRVTTAVQGGGQCIRGHRPGLTQECQPQNSAKNFRRGKGSPGRCLGRSSPGRGKSKGPGAGMSGVSEERQDGQWGARDREG